MLDFPSAPGESHQHNLESHLNLFAAPVCPQVLHYAICLPTIWGTPKSRPWQTWFLIKRLSFP